MNTTINGGPVAPGAPAAGLTPDTQEQMEKALKEDFATLAALLNFLRSHPRIIESIAEIAYQLHSNKLNSEEAIKNLEHVPR